MSFNIHKIQPIGADTHTKYICYSEQEGWVNVNLDLENAMFSIKSIFGILYVDF